MLATATNAADRRVIVTDQADYSGFDLGAALKGVTLDACKTACLGNKACQAFTFNTKAGWCFLKSDFGALEATPGAVAGRVVAVADLTPTLERRRLAELTFLPQFAIDEARAQIGDLKRRYDTRRVSYNDMRHAGGVSYRAGQYDDAATSFGRALAIADEDVNAWFDYAVASVSRRPDGYSDQQQAWTDASAAAINTYLRAETADDRAEALSILGEALGLRENWKPAIRAYRASLAIKDVKDVRDAYDKMVAEHGFRILSHDVEADNAQPSICIRFSDPLPVAQPGLADYVTVDGGSGLAIEPQASQICINGIQHGARYIVRVRAGLPAADGEKLAHPVELNIYVRDRSPWVGFAGNAYVLPAGAGASIPLSSVNTDRAKATIYRIGDRGLAEAVRNGRFLSQLSVYSSGNIADNTGEKVWEGEVLIKSELNRTETTAIPIADAVPEMKPGAYVITAQPATSTQDWGPVATQWFIVSDMGLSVLSGDDGIHVFVRALSSARPVAGASLRLVAVNNEILGEATTDADGVALFQPGLARGTGGAAPQLVVAEAGSDYAFIDLTRSAFDLSDRGVDGRPAPGALDVFLTPERGIYRPGETVHLTALVRDAHASAVGDLPLTLIVERPDGVEFLRKVLSDGGAGGYSDDVALQADAMRGAWRVALYADPKGHAIAETSLLVEDFEPERLAVELSSDAAAFDSDRPTAINVDAKYLYGAPGAGLPIEGDVALAPTRTLAAFPGYSFGLADDEAEATRQPLDLSTVTDDDGKASIDVTLPTLPSSTQPFNATLILRVTDTNGRAVERSLTKPVAEAGTMIGIKPLFDGEVAEGGEARFEAILVGADGRRIAKPGVPWKLERLESDYQWYRTDDDWHYELITNATKVAGGTVDFTADAPARIAANVDWGDYRLTIEDAASDAPSATSVDFYAGWYQAAASSDTPDTLKVALDKPAYRIGDTARLRLDPRFPGIALITVMDDRLIAMKSVDVPEGGTTVDLPITADWGPGAYVTATLYRPMDLEAKRMPARALGLAWAKVAPGDRQLDVALDLPDEVRPRGPMTIPVAIDNLQPGADAYVTVAAVDVGILNLTNFKAPAPDDWYFGQRALGMEIRDVYGMLIDRTQGVPGEVRSGGDSSAARLRAPPPTQKLLAFYSGIVQVDDAGKASVTFDLPDFNGTVRVMAMAWTKDGVGHAAKDVFVRDPVVVTASIPRFLAVGDTSRLLVEIDNVSGPAGDYRLSLATGEGVAIADGDAERTVALAEKQKVAFNIPIAAEHSGDFDVALNLASPSGEAWPTTLTLGVRPPGQPVTRRSTVAVAPGGKLVIDSGLLAEFVPGTTSVSVSLGGAGPLDVPGILAALDRYPYGCAEQITSRAMPLVYLDDVAVTIGIAADAAVKERVQKAVAGVLADQAGSGSFGLWGPQGAGNDLWLDAYVTDFLTRAADKGYDVPKLARDLALDNLANRISYANDFDEGGEDIAYALYVLARTGRAAVGDLRYYTDSKLGAFSTPLAKAQLGAAMALYGDRQRSARAFSAAMSQLDKNEVKRGWRTDYGTSLRDQAAVLTLAAETSSDAVDIRTLATRIAANERAKRYHSTQENAWMLLAAAALIKDSAQTSFSLDGETINAPLFRRFDGARVEGSPVEIANLGGDSLDALVSVSGIPLKPDPAGGSGFRIERSYFTPAGEPADVSAVAQNDRLVVVLNVTATDRQGGHFMVVDPVPAGFEIENPDISLSGNTNDLDWLSVDEATHTEARTDRFMAALDRDDDDPLDFTVAYTVRAVSPGVFAQPAATVEDMYQPERNAHTAAGKVEVVGPTR